MPRPIHRLSDKQCKHAKPGKLGDGGGLLLRTTAQGSSRWAFQYARDGKTREMGLGGYAAVSLAKARSMAEKQRKVLAAGKDLFRERDLAKMRLKKERTFTSVAAEYIRVQRHGWSRTLPSSTNSWCPRWWRSGARCSTPATSNAWPACRLASRRSACSWRRCRRRWRSSCAPSTRCRANWSVP